MKSLSYQGMLSEPRDLGRELTTELHGRGHIAVVEPKCGLYADLSLTGYIGKESWMPLRLRILYSRRTPPPRTHSSQGPLLPGTPIHEGPILPETLPLVTCVIYPLSRGLLVGQTWNSS